MRLRGSFLFFTLFVVAMIVCWGRARQAVRATVRILRDAPAVMGVTRSQTYPLSEHRWLKFRLNPNAKTARVVTNANLAAPLPAMAESSVRPGWRYAVEYRVAGPQGETLTQQLFHFRTQVTMYDDLLAGGQTTGNLLTDKELIPADARSLRIPLQELRGQAAELHLRTARMEGPISDVAVRVACLEEREDHDDPRLWQRLGASRIESFREDSIYPMELLTFQQRQEMLHWRWRPISPVGVDGRDYQRRVMYVRDASAIRVSNSEFSSPLPIVQRDKRLVFRLPHEPGRLRLSFELQQVGDARQHAHTIVSATWHGPTTLQPSEFQWKLPAANATLNDVELEISGGKLELYSTRPTGVQAFWKSSEGTQTEIELEPLLARTYPCSPENGAGLLYRISHVDDRPTPLRVKFRRQVPARVTNPNLPPIPVTWELLGREGVQVAAGVVEIDAIPSVYDWIDVVDADMRISDPLVRYWEVSPAAVAIRFAVQGDETVYIAAANRPPGLTRQVDVSRDSLEDINTRSLWRTWFELRPEQHVELCRLQRTLIVQQQTRPPDIDEEILANRYQWESFKPSGEWTGRYVLLPQSSGGLVRDEALAATFVELPTNEDTQINVAGEYGQSAIVSLALVNTSAANGDCTIHVDDREPIAVRGANSGTIELGAVMAGPHSIRIDSSSPLLALINNSQLNNSEDSTQLVKRFAIRANQDQFTFEIEKRSPSEELIALDYFFAQGAQSPREIRVTVEASGMSRNNLAVTTWSCRDNVFLIHPPKELHDHGYVLGKKGPANLILRRQRCYVFLGDNLPAGPLRIHVVGASAVDDYLIVSRVTPGDYEQRQISTIQTVNL